MGWSLQDFAVSIDFLDFPFQQKRRLVPQLNSDADPVDRPPGTRSLSQVKPTDAPS